MKNLLIILYILLVVMVAGLISSKFFVGHTYSWHRNGTTIADEQKIILPSVTFLAAGDIMLSRDVAGAVKKSNDPLLPFRGLDNLLRSTDFNFANLESPINGTNQTEAFPSFKFNSPTYTLPGLTTYNFKVLNLANNHAFDQDKAGLDNTEKYLTSQSITTLGTGETRDQAWQGKIVRYHDIDIGFAGASYSSGNTGGTVSGNYVARIDDLARMKTSVLDLKSRADFVVVTMHAGIEYTREPDQDQIDFARAAIDAGADIIIGAHPHWVQTTEVYKGKYIFYSLGNFIFDQMFSQDTREGLTLKITIDKTDDIASLKQIELIPIIIDNYCCPRMANDEEAKAILKKIGQSHRLLP